MSDWTHEEFMKLAGLRYEKATNNILSEDQLKEMPKTVVAAVIDWNNAGKVHPVKN